MPYTVTPQRLDLYLQGGKITKRNNQLCFVANGYDPAPNDTKQH
jgi:hypothetical protein